MLTRTEINLIAERTAELLSQTQDELMSAKQCASWLGISIKTLYARCCRGQMPSHKRHGNVYFSKNEVTTYLLKDKPAS